MRGVSTRSGRQAVLPRVLEPAVSGGSLGPTIHGALTEAFRACGAVLLRGFTGDCSSIRSFSGEYGHFMTYSGGATPREAVDGDPTCVSVRAGAYTGCAPLHGEMYYRASHPLVLWFYCEQPAHTGGEMLLCDAEAFWRSLSPSTQELLSTRPICYRRQYPDGLWQGVFRTDEVDRVREVCRSAGVGVQFLDAEDGTTTVTTEFRVHAVRTTDTGRRLFLNNVLPTVYVERTGVARSLGIESVVRIDDDRPLPDEVIAELEAVAEALQVEVPLQRGDLLVVDNARLLHGRRAFTGERVLVERLSDGPISSLGVAPTRSGIPDGEGADPGAGG